MVKALLGVLLKNIASTATSSLAALASGVTNGISHFRYLFL